MIHSRSRSYTLGITTFQQIENDLHLFQTYIEAKKTSSFTEVFCLKMKRYILIPVALAMLLITVVSQDPTESPSSPVQPGSCESVCSRLNGNCGFGLRSNVSALAATPCFDTNTNTTRTCNCNLTFDQLQSRTRSQTIRDCVIPENLQDIDDVRIRANIVNVYIRSISSQGRIIHTGNIERSSICVWSCGDILGDPADCTMEGRVIDSTMRQIDAVGGSNLFINGSRFSRNTVVNRIDARGVLHIANQVRFRNNNIGSLTGMRGIELRTDFRSNTMNAFQIVTGNFTVSGDVRQNTVNFAVIGNDGFEEPDPRCIVENPISRIIVLRTIALDFPEESGCFDLFVVE